ncbi:bifunctional diaminohydroxyphosphoribosylaminopyrimidine deaminase/5-amino-6-(5-phosphoribosylamino)uracil reductase RibD [bacterium 1xD8-6]|nr:bifunctional diaminohydroxyphosphoribosylaminopyrimidine deaminase/5-amino-6-(5-phosphoribosylamino)uracil reductase RibD [bacterium D16-36]RKI72540.1 bifunctional diaminohydroxyphosphoribosylaminopyrimidine deaminase/5-amino-6-(5-phosphoribosylamino)uracil reductase RibD [bacterium 1xD8-6]
MVLDREYMLRAIELAKKGIGKVNPNPLVGAVIVKDGRIIGEGYHAGYGGLHAERHAFSNLTEDAEGAAMYVTLEPCCHYGKQPPCTQAIIEHGISKVYVGSDDPNELVAGKGIRQLQDAGIKVETQFMKEECDALNPMFFHFITTKTPYVVMKYAMTMDGKTACDTGKSQWITGGEARSHVQETRNALRGIMVGVQTVINDNPSLTCRIPGGRNPVRIICDSSLRIPLDSNIVRTAKEIPTIVAAVSEKQEEADALREAGVQVLIAKERQGRVDLRDLMRKLGEQKIDGILLEGGGTLNQNALESGIVNHVQAYLAPKIFGGSGRYTPVSGIGAKEPDGAYFLENQKIQCFGRDILLEYDVVANHPQS